MSLCHGDRFGLIPNHFWYEVINCPDQDSGDMPTDHEVTKEVCIKEERNVEENGADSRDSAKDSEETIQFENNEEDADQNRSGSPSIMSKLYIIQLIPDDMFNCLIIKRRKKY